MGMSIDGAVHMSGFLLGLVIGCYAGAVGTLLLLLAVHSIPDGGSPHTPASEPWNGVGLIAAIMIACGLTFSLLNLHRVAFPALVLMLLVFVAARLRGMLVSWMTLALATVTLCMILPPNMSLSIADRQDQYLLVFFVVCGTLGTRFIAQNQRA
jgi:ABC-type branched-subunit amino acid transport system permease subunit